MNFRILSRNSIAAVTGAAMLAASSASTPAFTLSAPSLERPVAAVGFDTVVWHRGWHGGWHRGWHGGWHRGWGWHGGWHRWGWGPGWGYGFGPVWRCWWSPWGFRRCGWV